MEPDRNIEKELKAYAQQRRAEAGAPLEATPAARKLFQEEAARLAKSAGDGRSSGANPWWSSLLRLAVAGCAAAAVVVACWIFLPMFSKDRNRTSATQAYAALDRDRVSAQNAERAEERTAAKLTPFNAPLETGSPPLSAPVSSAPPAPAPMPVASARAPVAMTPAIPAALPVDGGKSGENATNALGSGFSATFASLAGTATTKSSILTNGDYALDFVDVPATSIVQRFRRLDFAQKDDSAGAIGGGPKVLSLFRVEQASEKLRVIDSDGSVYSGFVEKTPQDGKPATRALFKSVVKPNAAADDLDAKKAELPVRIYRFRVSGTNRTLKEEVVFTGNFLMNGGVQALSAAEPTNGPVTGALVPGAAGEAQPLELRKARVEGRLLLGGTNKVEIKAEPAKP